MLRKDSSHSVAGKRLALLVAAAIGVLTLGTASPAAAAPKAQNGEGCTVLGTLADDKLQVVHARDVVCGLGGNDTIIGGRGNDVLDGGPGDDTLVGGAGADLLLGGPGTDTVSYADHRTAVKADLDGRAGDGSTGENDRVGLDVENLIGGDANDVLTGSGGPNGLNGGAGDDILRGGAGNDKVRGQAGNDQVHGEAGNDQVRGDDGNDQVRGEDGNDALDGGPGDDFIDGGAGDDDLEGGSGLNTCVADPRDHQGQGKCTDLRHPYAEMTSLSWAGEPKVDNSTDRTITLRLKAGDDRSGLMYVWVKLRSPDPAAPVVTLGFGNTRLVSGTTTDGSWELTGVLPALSAIGNWSVSEVYVQDRVYRYTRYTVKSDGTYTGSEYGYAGVISLAPLVVTGVADQDAPVADLTAAGWKGATVLDNATAQTVTLRLPVTDDLSGVTTVTATLNATGPVGGSTDDLTLRLTFARLVSGTTTNGVWEVTGTVPAYTPAGDWQVSTLSLTDRVGHLRTLRPGADAAVAHLQISGISDLEAPTADLSSAEYVGSTTADNSAARKVTMRMRFSDDVSGVASVFLDYRTVGAQSRLDSQGEVGPDGVWTLTGTLPAGTTPGQWRVTGIYITDRVGRERVYYIQTDGRYVSRDGSLAGIAALPAFTLTPC